MSNPQQLADFIWRIADLLRGPYKRADYGKIILPFTILRRLDCMLEPTKDKVLAVKKTLPDTTPQQIQDAKLKAASGVSYYNTYPETLRGLMFSDQTYLKENLLAYVQAFNKDLVELFDGFEFTQRVDKLKSHKLLLLVLKDFGEVDMSPQKMPHELMGAAYEELIRRFAEASNETAGEHFTPREVIELMTHVLINEEHVNKPGLITTVYDPACGTGGMLMGAYDTIKVINPKAQVRMFGQELNPESYAICKADVLIHDDKQGTQAQEIYPGNTFTEDGAEGKTFDYMLCNPPFGVDWKKYEKEVKDEAENLGYAGRFGAGLPSISDGSLLFLQHMLSKMHPTDKHPLGSRIAIVFNGSPLFTGGAGSGPSEIRRWIIENDWLDTIIALPDQLFYNTGISTYIWVLHNAKPASRKGKIRLIDGTSYYEKMPRSIGNKRHRLGEQHIKDLTKLYWELTPNSPNCKIFPNEHFGYTRIVVERPLRLNYGATEERLERLEEALAQRLDKERAKTGKSAQTKADELEIHYEALLALAEQLPEAITTDGAAFEKRLRTLAKEADIKLSAPDRKLLLDALSERDPEAPPVLDANGQPVADPDLRDNENVPLTDDIAAYMAREVLPYAPDAWVSQDKDSRIGYEIGLTREFYTYQPPRPLATIEDEIEQLVQSLEGHLQAITQAR